MAVNLTSPSSIPPVPGIRIGAADAGIRKSSGEDLVVFAVPETATIAGVFTQNKARAAPVEVAIEHLNSAGARHSGANRALVINSGNANAGLGSQGIEDCLAICDMVAAELKITRDAVLPFSTGVIGERLPLERFSTHLGECIATLCQDNWVAASRSILTTDTVSKAASRTIELNGGERVVISGIAKGSGMIEPNMATMLAFLATDAKVDPAYLQTVLESAVDESFNCITVDGDTSTNDACMLIATAESGIEISEHSDSRVKELFTDSVREVATQLAQAIVRDGEGASKFITIRVTGGRSQSDCRMIAKTVANSPLVKTALHASDPNWGRIYAAIGRAPVEDLHLDRVNININDVVVMSAGKLNPDYREADAAAAMIDAELSIGIDLGIDQSGESATVWTTDFSYEYIRINAEYRT